MPHVLQLSSLANHKSFFSFRCKFDLCESEKQKSVTIRGEKKGGGGGGRGIFVLKCTSVQKEIRVKK